ncbi:putative uncharacterized protein DDB_G0282133 [Glossina fuscipes]|uniref:Uncharacterized protein n=1 Tax=Glossina fuscipes TaxID=7396 RepID=A0A9C5YWE4_9MUSC|nr:putative uncharacterized protein DDB_G0282133 [Glossina fuscipes]
MNMMLSHLFRLIVILGLLFAVRVLPLNAAFNGRPSLSAFSWNDYRLDDDSDVTDDLLNKRMQIWYYTRPLYLHHDPTPTIRQQSQSNDGNILPNNIHIDSNDNEPEVVDGNSNTNNNNNNNIDSELLPAIKCQRNSKRTLSTQQQQKLLRLYNKLQRDNDFKENSKYLINNGPANYLQQPQTSQLKGSVHDIDKDLLRKNENDGNGNGNDDDSENDYNRIDSDRENHQNLDSKANADQLFRAYVKRMKYQEKQQQQQTFLPSISGGVMTNLGKFFRDLSKNVHYSEQYRWDENEQKLLEGHRAIASFQNHLPDGLPDHKNQTAHNAELIQAIRFYRPSQKIRSLVMMNPHGQWSHDSKFIDPNYMWVGLGK